MQKIIWHVLNQPLEQIHWTNPWISRWKTLARKPGSLWRRWPAASVCVWVLSRWSVRWFWRTRSRCSPWSSCWVPGLSKDHDGQGGHQVMGMKYWERWCSISFFFQLSGGTCSSVLETDYETYETEDMRTWWTMAVNHFSGGESMNHRENHQIAQRWMLQKTGHFIYLIFMGFPPILGASSFACHSFRGAWKQPYFQCFYLTLLTFWRVDGLTDLNRILGEIICLGTERAAQITVVDYCWFVEL